MVKDQVIGGLILVISLIGILAYFYLLFLSGLAVLTLQITAFVGVAAILVILMWIGYTLATTPAPEPLPETPETSPSTSATQTETETKK